MAKIKTFDRRVCKGLADEIIQKLQPIAKRYGISVVYKGGSFTPQNFIAKLEIATVGSSGEINSKERDDFKRYATWYGFKPSDLDRQFEGYKGTYTIFGLKPKSRQYPIIGKDIFTGKLYKFRVNDVKKGMKGE